MRLLVFAPLLAAACGSDSPVEIHAASSTAPAISAFAAALPGPAAHVSVDDDPVKALSPGAGLRVAVVSDLTGCHECFRVEPIAAGFVVHGDGALGAQYGLSALLESAGYRFHQPLRPLAPSTIAPPPSSDPTFGATHAPEKALRGIHLHTLHPIEGYFDYWEDGALDEVKRIHAWVVENRGNYVEWVALADVESDPARQAAWRARTKQIIDDAHLRGLEVGISVELFHSSDLQNGFDLLDGDPRQPGAQAAIDQRLQALAGLGIDKVNVTFGEFQGVDPQAFVDVLSLASREIASVLGAEATATIHIGGLASQQVTYMGQTMQYYFLAQFASPPIVPWIHTVMYFDLFEDTGGAYDVDNFDEHRKFLLARLAAGQPVVYYPESAYWISFDDSVPVYLPLYVRSRYLDMASIRTAAKAQGSGDLDGHVEFSSGFEWGYWQQDRAALRMSFALPATWQDAVADEVPAALRDDVVQLTALEHDALIDQRLAAYLAGRDAYIDAGDQIGIHSQPDRPSFQEVVAMSDADRATFQANVVAPLGALADAIAQVATSAAMVADPGDPDQAEILDGARVTAARARFIHALYAAAVAKAAGQDTAALLATANAALTAGQAAVKSRHAKVPALYLGASNNQTIYPFGYLAQADTLCYWQREMLQIDALLDGKSRTLPTCIN